MRRALVNRNTSETRIRLRLNLDGTGKYDVRTGIRFLDHMLELVARHGGFDLTVAITGDLVDGSVPRLAPHVAPLARLEARHGVFFVTGNHEYYAGVDEW